MKQVFALFRAAISIRRAYRKAGKRISCRDAWAMARIALGL